MFRLWEYFMSKNREPYPERKPVFEVGIGHYENHWFVGIKPPISSELLTAAGGNAIRGWAVEDLEGKDTGATVLRKYTNANQELAMQTGVTLVIGLARETGKSPVFSAAVVEMEFDTAPFQSLQPTDN